MTSSEPPLRAVALRYLKAGWNPVELPAGAKHPPPEGRTGYGGSDMTKEDVEVGAWVGNVGLRMPADVIGLDVDVYKGGARTLDGLFRRCGPLPNSWISQSGRGDGSGIRFYRVPPGLAWISGLAGIEIIQRVHRYAVVWPSLHPEGRPYSWVNQDEGPTVEIPVVEDLPELPWAWISELSRAMAAETSAPSRAVDQDALETFLVTHTTADQPSYISTILAHFTERWKAGYSRHDTMQHCLIWAMECARAGVASARPTVEALADLWIEALGPDARRAEPRSERRTTEFEAMLRHAVGRVVAKPEAEILRLHDDIAGPPIRTVPPGTGAAPPVDHPEAEEEGIFLDWAAFAGRNSVERRWLVERFWPWGRAMALWAAAKTGKSELALYVAAKLALGEHPWTGDPIEPLDVAYFDFEMGLDDLDDRLSDFGFEPSRLGRLHYALLPPLHALDVETGGREVEELVLGVGAAAAVIDTFGRAVTGDENEADTVRAFYRFTGSRLKRAGVGYVRLDHAGKDPGKGQRGSSAKRDDVDIVWHLTRSETGVLLDCSGSSRLSWVEGRLALNRTEASDGTLSYSTARLGWSAGTKDRVAALDAAAVPLDAGRDEARKLLKAAGQPGARNDRLDEALRFRRSEAERFFMGTSDSPQEGTVSRAIGDEPPEQPSDQDL